MTINNVAIIGAGVQGTMLIYRNAVYGKSVNVYEIVEEVIESSKRKILLWLNNDISSGKINKDEMENIFSRISYCSEIGEAISDADIVIENVPEKLEVKISVWETIDKIAPPKTIITTNSSSLKSSSINPTIERKEKTFNINFSTPNRDDMVEVMWNSNTSEVTKQAIFDYLNSINNVAIVTNKEIKGFSMNRVWRAMKKECLYLWANGYTTPEDLDRAFMLEWGTNEGPFGVMDQVGLDTIWNIEMSYYQESQEEKDKPPQVLKDMVDRGELGEKSGKGFYSWPNPIFRETRWLRKND
jgi:3-hydroxybutyryl-CoA dehydrogenase